MRKPRKTPPKTEKPLKPASDAREGNIYDKMIKENLEKSIKTIVRDIGGIQFVKVQPLPTKMQHTKERDPDELSLIWLPDGKQNILHAEAHLKDENDVNLRMCDYHIMLKRSKHKKIPIIHIVIYMGTEDPKHIRGFWQSECMTFHYKVIILKDIPYEIFLQATNPETVVFSILADFHEEDPEIVGKKISERIKTLAESDSAREKYYTQLRVLSKIRKLQPIIEKVMANIFKLIDISDDPLYVKGINEGELRGELRGELKGKLKGVESFIMNTDFDDAYIALLMAVPLELVQQTRQKLATKNSINGH